MNELNSVIAQVRQGIQIVEDLVYNGNVQLMYRDGRKVPIYVDVGIGWATLNTALDQLMAWKRVLMAESRMVEADPAVIREGQVVVQAILKEINGDSQMGRTTQKNANRGVANHLGR